MSTATLPNTATQTKVVRANNVSKVFKRDAFEVEGPRQCFHRNRPRRISCPYGALRFRQDYAPEHDRGH